MKTILYTKSFNEDIKEPVNVILSPEFYWIKKIEIPIKSLKDAKKIAKTLFKLNGDYIYDAFELDGKFFALAYEKDLKLTIPNQYIKSIRLAQIEFYNHECIDLDYGSLKKINDIIFYFPTKSGCEDIKNILPNLKLSNKTFNINKLQLDKGLVITLSLIFILINAGLLFKTFAINKDIQKIQNERSEFLQKHSLPLTSIQLSSILNNLKTTYKNQIKIKKDIEFISMTPLKKNEYFKDFSFDSKTYSVEIKTSKNLDRYFQKRFKILNSSFSNGIYKASLK